MKLCGINEIVQGKLLIFKALIETLI